MSRRRSPFVALINAVWQVIESSFASVAQLAHSTWRGRGSVLGGAWLLAVGVGIGLVIGWCYGWAAGKVVRHYVPVSEINLPKPVTPPPAGARWVQVLTTGYCPCAICCERYAAFGKTSIGRDVHAFPFGIASDHHQIPVLTRLEIPGYGVAEVDDTGGAMRQDAEKGEVHIDLRFVEHQQALKWGRRRMWIAMPLSAPAAKAGS